MKSTKGDRGQLKKGSSGRGREKTTTRKKRAGEEQRMQKGKDTDVGDREREESMLGCWVLRPQGSERISAWAL